MLRFSKVPGDLYCLGVQTLSARHLNMTNPNFHKLFESRSPKSESSALTTHIGMDAAQTSSLGLQD